MEFLVDKVTLGNFSFRVFGVFLPSVIIPTHHSCLHLHIAHDSSRKDSLVDTTPKDHLTYHCISLCAVEIIPFSSGRKVQVSISCILSSFKLKPPPFNRQCYWSCHSDPFPFFQRPPVLQQTWTTLSEDVRVDFVTTAGSPVKRSFLKLIPVFLSSWLY
jgi:hypothetical protein